MSGEEGGGNQQRRDILVLKLYIHVERVGGEAFRQWLGKDVRHTHNMIICNK